MPLYATLHVSLQHNMIVQNRSLNLFATKSITTNPPEALPYTVKTKGTSRAWIP